MTAAREPPTEPDKIFLTGLSLSACIGTETWHRPYRHQPVILDISLPTSIAAAGASDDVQHTIHYGELCKAATDTVELGSPWASIRQVADAVSATALSSRGHFAAGEAEVRITLPKAVIMADGFGIVTTCVLSAGDARESCVRRVEERLFFRDARIACVIGVNPHEREERQWVVLNLTLYLPGADMYTQYAPWFRRIVEFIEKSSYKTLEALATRVADMVLSGDAAHKVTVSLQKPSALTFVREAGVEITRSRKSESSAT